MGKRGFIAYDPELARVHFGSDIVVTIYYKKLLRYDEILEKDSEGFFSRSADQIRSATCITRRQQDRVRTWLVLNGHLITEVRVPKDELAPVMHFKLLTHF